jgi:hypothetical protein
LAHEIPIREAEEDVMHAQISKLIQEEKAIKLGLTMYRRLKSFTPHPVAALPEEYEAPGCIMFKAFEVVVET